jgi:Collagen triple helix repeat (20 copies)
MVRSELFRRFAVLTGTCLAGIGLAGLPGADASTGGPGAQAASGQRLCVAFDTEDPFACAGPAPQGRRGARGPRGYRGFKGSTGAVGAVGPTGGIGPVGPVGKTGPQGATGDKGVVGVTGVVGADGAFVGNTNHLILVVSAKDFLPSTGGPLTGTELSPPMVARCPPGNSSAAEAFDGGVTVTTSGPNDVVTVEQSFPGIFVSSTEVDPLPSAGAPAGSVSNQPANAYEGQVVITRLDTGDTVTAQAWVNCGP